MGNRWKYMITELLAPAGSYEGFEAALGAGADAVYLGGAAFGARAYAKNFEQDELIRAIETAHIHGKKLYLTVNTLLKNREMQEQLYDYLAPYYEAGLDAVIVQDMGVMTFIQENFPGLPIHASTQMTVTGPEGMRFLEEKGVARVVPARELSLEEIQAMRQSSSLEIETFVHGALCYSYSGQCLMSSILGGRSGNRGRCAQPCRLPYQVSADGKKYKGGNELCPLSLKDICTIDILPEIIEAGVMSLKIEGRMKQPSYTAGVTSVYRKYLDYLKKYGPTKYAVEEKDRQFLIDVFNRGGSCEGYYKQHNGPEMMAFSNEKKTGDVSPKFTKLKKRIDGELIIYPECPVILNLSCGDVHVTAAAGEVQYAKNQPMEEARVRQQMEKLGDTEFEWDVLEIQMDESIFVPVKVLNEVRRDALNQLQEALCAQYRRTLPERVTKDKKSSGNVNGQNSEKTSLYVSCETVEQMQALYKNKHIKGFYVPYDVMKWCMEQGISKEVELYLSLPHMVRGEAPQGYFEIARHWIEEGMKGFLVRNMEGYGMVKTAGFADKCVLDHSLYSWNKEAVDFWKKEGVLRLTAPLELNEKELRHRDNSNSELLVYGYLPVMMSAQCVRKNTKGCDRKQDQMLLRDRYEKVFASVCYCNPWKMSTTGNNSRCYNIIYNSIPYGLLNEKKQVDNLNFNGIRLSFTVESGKVSAGILDEFINVYYYDKEASKREFTKGHFKRGAE